MDWTSFTLKIGVKTSIGSLYKAWTVSEEVEKWFLESCVFLDENGQAAPQAASGNTYDWKWFLDEDHESGKILEANGRDFFQFTFAGQCLVDINLEQVGESVMVKLRQHNIPTDENSKFDIRIGCTKGWTFFLTNLKSIYENGLDLRNQKPELEGLNN
jgi:uncharacterized protein YndB with AHSA1/START domain